MIYLLLLVMVEVVFILGPPTSPTRNFIFSHVGMLGVLVHIRIIAHHPPLFNHSVEIIQLVMLVVLNLVFMLVMVEAVLVH